MPTTACPTDAPPPQVLLVLDTNVVLDWLVFGDAGCDALGVALGSGQARWIASAAMRDELEHVLTRGTLGSWEPDVPAILRTWSATVNLVPALSGPSRGTPRCTDPDDQKFIDLALQCGASALLSRDRAVLRCARRARPLGLAILTPTAWAQR